LELRLTQASALFFRVGVAPPTHNSSVHFTESPSSL
jgi:hypothetical protein